MLTSVKTLWAMNHDHLASMMAGAGKLRRPTARQLARAYDAQAKALRQVNGKVAVLPMYGVVQQRMTMWGYYGGACSTELLGNAIDTLLGRQEVAALVLDVDSPGGTAYGVQELSDLIYSRRGEKPIVGVANSMAASAAYWCISACDQVAVTPGGDVGSVGVYLAHEDWSQAFEDAGVKVTIVKSGKYKAEGNPYEPLSADAKENYQAECDACYSTFVKSVARNRGVSTSTVLSDFGQGRCLGAGPALAAKMVDRVATLGQVLGKLMGTGAAARGAAANAGMEMLRRRQQRRKLQAGWTEGQPC